MSDKQVPDLNQLASMTANDFRAMGVNALVDLAVNVARTFNGLQVAAINPAYAEVLAEIEKTEKASSEKTAFAHGKQVYDAIKASALGELYIGFRLEVYEGESGLVTRLNYITKEKTKREVRKVQPSASKVLKV